MKQDDVVLEGSLPRTSEAVDWWLKQWGRNNVLSGGEPMSREDVEGSISANGGTAAGLDLIFENLRSANLSGMDLREVLFQAADLGRTDLREADLFRADLRGAFLMQANIKSAYLLAVRIDDQTNLEDIDWGDKYINGWEQIKFYRNALASYRQLNTWHQNHGHYDIAGEFLYREWVCKRLEAWEQLSDCLSWRRPWRTLQALNFKWLLTMVWFLWLGVHELIFGYGERPMRVIMAASCVVLGFALVYFIYRFSEVVAAGRSEFLARSWYSFYFFLVSFTTLGYGGWIEHPDNWLRYLGELESFIGLFLTATFLVTFTRKWTK